MIKRFADICFNRPLQSAYTYAVPDDFKDPVGKRVVVDFNGRRMTGYAIRSYEAEEGSFGYPVKPILKIQDADPLFGEFQIQTARWIAERYFCSVGEALSCMVPGGKREVDSLSLWDDGGPAAAAGVPRLTEEQRSAVDTILGSDKIFFYLFGITGSGKTEVYLNVARQTLEKGRGVLYLVPEIALTHQLTDLVVSRFGNRVSVIHSGLTPAQKYTQWRRILRGEADFVIGARSAVFAPLPDLGLIILDEEHEGSYKSQSVPRYHARQAAMYIAQQNGAKLVMGSATPSAEAYEAMRMRKVEPLILKQRPAGGRLPRFHVIDMRGRRELLSAELIQAVAQTLREGRQVILFLNRRGFSYAFRCRTCGFTFRCPYCSLPLTYHKRENRFICHCCGRMQPPVHYCPQCRSFDVGYAGIGTEKIEEETTAIFPDVKTERVDRDTVKNAKELGAVLERFRQGETRILMGTQMIAKGLNFPGVKTVGIVSVDNILRIPDFRSAERAFSLIMQAAGRAGRYSDDGEVYIQTEMGHHPALVHAVKGEADEFYREELMMRQAAGFPPFSGLVHLVCKSVDRDTAETAITRLAEVLQNNGIGADELLGPTEAPVAKLNGKYRFHCLIRTSRPQKYAKIVKEAAAAVVGEFRRCQIDIDADPLSVE